MAEPCSMTKEYGFVQSYRRIEKTLIRNPPQTQTPPHYIGGTSYWNPLSNKKDVFPATYTKHAIIHKEACLCDWQSFFWKQTFPEKLSDSLNGPSMCTQLTSGWNSGVHLMPKDSFVARPCRSQSPSTSEDFIWIWSLGHRKEALCIFICIPFASCMG
jgi:hypothetical protein